MSAAERLAIARPYAEAAFRFAKAHHAIVAWQGFLNTFSALVADEKIAAILMNPFVDQTQVIDSILRASGEKIEETQANFLKQLAENSRLIDFPAITRQFEALCDQEANILRVEVESAFELNTTEKKRLQKKLEEKMQKQIVMNTHLDSSLIGGLRIKFGDSVLDASLKSRLQQLNQDLS